jgi:ribonuclease BN (tRNA processing enzyme)
MKDTIRVKLTALVVGLFAISAVQADGDKKRAVDKVKGSFSVVVLGSGGPRAADNGRASSGYLIFVEGKPRILMDMGGGTFKSLAMSGANIPEIDRLLLTHLHLDHTADMSAMVKTIFFHNRSGGTFRTAPVHFYGPEANGIPFPPVPPLAEGDGVPQYPNLSDYVHGHYNLKTGVERYLNAFTLGTQTGRFTWTATDLPSDWNSNGITTVFEDPDGLTVKSIAVHHGPVPAVAYRIEYEDKSIVWSGDTSSKTDNMIRISMGADLLIYDTAIMVDDPPSGTIFHTLHTIPERIGVIAAEASPKTLLLSHLTTVTDPRSDEVRRIVRAAGFAGKIEKAEDLMVINLDR